MRVFVFAERKETLSATYRPEMENIVAMMEIPEALLAKIVHGTEIDVFGTKSTMIGTQKPLFGTEVQENRYGSQK